MNEEIMRQMGFIAELARIKKGKCPFCEKTIDHASFKNDMSRREFKISGLCQECQDDIFRELDEKEEEWKPDFLY